jgi:disulfide bond formation protein DsbB
MSPLTSVMTNILSVLTVVGDVAILAIVVILVIGKNKPLTLISKTLKYLAKNALIFAFVVSLTATLGSLFYSEVAGYEPCKLCWIQRIFMYPQPILLALGLAKKDRSLADYILTLSFIGAPISAYHYFLQINPSVTAPCSTVGYSISCSKTFVLQLGYITIPMMALTAFLLTGLLMITQNLFQGKVK